MRVSDKEDLLKCHCSVERLAARKLHITWKESDHSLSDAVEILNIPGNCTCTAKDFNIPRRGSIPNMDNKVISWSNSFNISYIDFNITEEYHNDSKLMDYIKEIKEDFIHMKEKFSKYAVPTMMVKWSTPLQITQIGIFSFILITTLIILIIKYWQRNKSTNLQAEMRGQNISLNVVSTDSEC